MPFAMLSPSRKVADTVRGLCSGKGFLFADRGEFVAKGFEEPVRVYQVGWRDD